MSRIFNRPDPPEFTKNLDLARLDQTCGLSANRPVSYCLYSLYR